MFVPLVNEGAFVQPGKLLAAIHGPAHSVLSAERPALNALQHLSGIATFTHTQVQQLGRSKTKLLDTRKTLAWMAAFGEVRGALRRGDESSHVLGRCHSREGKSFENQPPGGSRLDEQQTFDGFKQKRSMPVQIEIQTSRDLDEVIQLRPELVLLDNMPFATLKKVIKKLRHELPRVQIEISGGVQPESTPAFSDVRG